MNGSAVQSFDIAVIGGGPAGMSAASLAAQHGAKTILIDEQPHLGGQIYRAVTISPLKGTPIPGADYWRGDKLVQTFTQSGAHHMAGATVWSVAPTLEIGVSIGGKAGIIQARQIILATGALERPFPVPGWTLPGVMTAGAAQILLKTSGLVANENVVLAGNGPLLWLLATQYLNAGAHISAILDTTPLWNFLPAIPHFPAFATSKYFGKGLGMLVHARRRIAILGNVTELRAQGQNQLEQVSFRQGGGIQRQLAANTLLLHQGVVPNINLSNALGCEMTWDSQQLFWTPIVDHWCRSSVKNIAIAGDGAGIGGAIVAEHLGRLSAIGALQRLGTLGADSARQQGNVHRRAAKTASRGRRFIDTLYRPAKQFRVPRGETIVCRCEEVTAQQVSDVIAMGCPGPNQAKAFLRCGMGPCQGRFCGLTLTEMFADGTGTAPKDVGYYRLRPPIKPVTVGELAALPRSFADETAVNREP